MRNRDRMPNELTTKVALIIAITNTTCRANELAKLEWWSAGHSGRGPGPFPKETARRRATAPRLRRDVPISSSHNICCACWSLRVEFLPLPTLPMTIKKHTIGDGLQPSEPVRQRLNDKPGHHGASPSRWSRSPWKAPQAPKERTARRRCAAYISSSADDPPGRRDAQDQLARSLAH